MPALAVAVVVLTAAANLAVAVAPAPFVLANSAEIGVAERWLPGLAALKAAGATGLLIGVAGVPAIGMAAAAGLVVFFAAALVVHVRARVLHNLAFPGLYFALGTASLVVFANDLRARGRPPSGRPCAKGSG
jgi:hypothetical protein